MISERRLMGLVLAGLSLILATALTIWFLGGFERRLERVPTGYSPEARRNALLAAERFIARLGIAVESVAGRERLRALPPTTDTLIVMGLGPMSAERQARLRAWIESGGRLLVEVMESGTDEAAADDVLARLGVRLLILDEEADAMRGDEVVALITDTDFARPLNVAFQSRYALEVATPDPGDLQVEGQIRLTRRALGQGWVTLISDSRFMTNAHIGERDHALFTAWLARPSAGGKVWILYDPAMPWLGALLWSAAPQALISAAVLLLLWVWSLGARLGPLTEAPERRRRDLIEHLEASADFLWRHGRAMQLVEASRRRILGEWFERHPEIAHAAPPLQAERIAAIIGRPVDRVARALFAQAEDARSFVEQAALLHALWSHRTRGVTRNARRP